MRRDWQETVGELQNSLLTIVVELVKTHTEARGAGRLSLPRIVRAAGAAEPTLHDVLSAQHLLAISAQHQQPERPQLEPQPLRVPRGAGSGQEKRQLEMDQQQECHQQALGSSSDHSMFEDAQAELPGSSSAGDGSGRSSKQQQLETALAKAPWNGAALAPGQTQVLFEHQRQ